MKLKKNLFLVLLLVSTFGHTGIAVGAANVLSDGSPVIEQSPSPPPPECDWLNICGRPIPPKPIEPKA